MNASSERSGHCFLSFYLHAYPGQNKKGLFAQNNHFVYSIDRQTHFSWDAILGKDSQYHPFVLIYLELVRPL